MIRTRARRNRIKSAIASLEPLESRMLMSVTISPSGGNDANAISNAIRGLPGGTVVNFSQGNYNLGSQLNLVSNLSYQGHGATFNGNTILISDGTNTEFTGFTLNGTLLHAQYAGGVNIHNNVFQNYNNGYTAVLVSNIHDSSVSNNTFTNISNGNGIYGNPDNNDVFDHNSFDHVFEPIHLSAVNDNTDISYNVINAATRFGIECGDQLNDLKVNGNYIANWLPQNSGSGDSHLGLSLAVGGTGSLSGAKNVEVGNNVILQTGSNQSANLYAKFAVEIMGDNVHLHDNYIADWGGAFLCGNNGPLYSSNNTLVNDSYYSAYSEGDGVPWNVPNAIVSGDRTYGSNGPGAPGAPQAGASFQGGSSSNSGSSQAPTPPPAQQTTTGGAISGSQANAASGYNLTSLGTSDWAKWGKGGNGGSFDHKNSGNSQISNVSGLGSGNKGGYYDNSRSTSWSDGTPDSSTSGDNGYIWANNSLGAGYSFSVPADTNSRTVFVYAGGNSSGATLTAHLSDGSSPDYTVSASGGGLYTNLYSITYHAASSGQKLTISYTKSSNVNGNNGGSVDLIGAALAGGSASAPSGGSSSGGSSSGGSSGSSSSANTGSGGSLSGSQNGASSSYNLTSVGSSDWAHWGRGGNGGNFDHKNGGNNQISNLTGVGSGNNSGGYYDSSRTVSWSNGTPTSSGQDNGYVWSNGSLNSGLQFTVAAGTGTHTLYVYAGGYNTTGTLRAHLSDNSASDYVATASGNGIYSNYYAITFKAGSANQSLTVTLLKTGNQNGQTNGSVDLVSAALV